MRLNNFLLISLAAIPGAFLRFNLNSNLMSNLIGTLGERASMDLMTIVKLADQMPKREDIIKDPSTAKVPDSASAVCMVVFSALASMD